MDKLSQLVSRFRQSAIRAADLSDTPSQHRAAKEVQACYQELRLSEEGREALIALISDPSPYVRLCAASRSLQWEPGVARVALESLRDNDGPGAFEAKWTLREYDEGNLSFDY